MTELEKIERAKMYMDKLANGINPIDDTMAPDDDLINNVRLSRCFFFVSDVLRQVIENGGTKTAVNKKSKKLPLADTIEHIIGEILSEYGEQSSILLIGRYNYDMYKLYRTNRFSELPGGAIRSEKYPNAKITFMTAHSSKGLGYDNVILINMFEGKFGFPCQIEDDPIIKLVTYEDNSMPFAEERRLFYVAMTRTKNRVYIAAPKTKPSRFLVELIKDFNIPHNDEINIQVVDLFNLRCPVCGFPLKYEFNKNYGLNLWICTNEAELCDFMTNDRTHMHDILKCPKCTDGYLIVKKNPKNGDIFYGCTNYFNEEKKCTYMVPLESGSKNDQ